MAVVEPTSAPLAAPSYSEAPQQVLRSADGDASHAPAFLKPREPRAPRAAAPAPVAAVEDAPAADAKPKRRRTVKAETEG